MEAAELERRLARLAQRRQWLRARSLRACGPDRSACWRAGRARSSKRAAAERLLAAHLRPLARRGVALRGRNAAVVSKRAVTGGVRGGGGGPPAGRRIGIVVEVGRAGRVGLAARARRPSAELSNVRAAHRIAQQVVGGVDARHARRESGGLLGVAGGSIGMMLARKLAPAPLDGASLDASWRTPRTWYGLPRKRSAGINRRGYHAAATHPSRIVASYSQRLTMRLPFQPPLEPMLAKLSTDMPTGDGWLFEPKWDGFRAIVFRDGDETYIQSRDLKPLDRYFPELPPALKANLPDRCVVDGEIVIPGDDGLEFESLLLRIHPAASRVNMLAEQTPASFVGWDLLALGDEDLRATAAGRAARR